MGEYVIFLDIVTEAIHLLQEIFWILVVVNCNEKCLLGEVNDINYLILPSP